MSHSMIRFTDGPSLSAVVRLDLQAAPAKVGASGFSIGAPDLRSDVESPTVSWGRRRITLTQHVEGPKSDAMPVMAALAREILRPRNWLMVQMSPGSKPVWFRTWRAQPGEMDLEQVYHEDGRTDRWEISVQVEAEPFAYGEVVTMSPQTITNDPATGCRITLPTIDGDAPTPLRIDAQFDLDTHGHRLLWHVAAHESDAGSTGPIVWQTGSGDGWTGHDGAVESDAAYSGGSYRKVSFSPTAEMQLRMEGYKFVPVGRYAVFMRVARSDTSTTFAFRLGQSAGWGPGGWGPTARMDRPTSPSAGHATWLDLGVHTFPFGALTDEGYADDDHQSLIYIEGERLSGTGTANIDAFILLPIERADVIEARTLTADYYGYAYGPDTLVTFDGDIEQVASRNTVNGLLQSLEPGDLSGRFPVAVPGATNVLSLLTQTSVREVADYVPDVYDNNTDDISSSTEVTISYFPRYLWLGA